MLSTKFDPNDYVCASTVSVTEVTINGRQFTISTVRLPKMKGDDDRFETCLFDDAYLSDDTKAPRSEVVGTYFTRFEAQVGHERLLHALAFFGGDASR